MLLLTKALALEGTALVARELGDRLGDLVGRATVERASSLLADPGISVVPEAMAVLDAGGVTALHDPTEGGLAMGVRELVLAAGCGVTIDREAVPVLPETASIAAALALDPLGMLASGSLLVAADPPSVDGLIAACDAVGVRLTQIGEVTDRADRFTLRVDGSRAGAARLRERRGRARAQRCSGLVNPLGRPSPRRGSGHAPRRR